MEKIIVLNEQLKTLSEYFELKNKGFCYLIYYNESGYNEDGLMFAGNTNLTEEEYNQLLIYFTEALVSNKIKGSL